MRFIIYHSLRGEQLYIIDPDEEDQIIQEMDEMNISLENYSREVYEGEHLCISMDNCLIVD